MKKGVLLLALLCLFLVSANSQEKIEKIEKIQLGKNERLLKSMDLGKNGLLIRIGAGIKYKLKFYTALMDKKWEVEGSFDIMNSPVIVSFDGDYVYINEYKGLRQGTMVFTQIDKTGKVRTFEKKIDIKNKKRIFCDNKFLYFLCTEKGNEYDKKKTEEKLLLNKFDHTNFTLTKSIVDLPKIKDPEITTFWTYVGHDNDEIFFSSKTIDEKNKSVSYHIISTDSDGKRIKDISLKVPLANKFVCPARNRKAYYGTFAGNGADDDFHSDLGSQSMSLKMVPYLGALSDVNIDKVNNSIYVLGLYNAKPYDWGRTTEYEGYFVCKYDMEGNIIFTIQSSAPKELLTDKYFKNCPMAYSTNVQLTPNSDQSLNFRIWFKDQLYTFAYSNKGEFSQYVKHVFKDWISYYDANAEVSPSEIEFFNSKNIEAKFNAYKKSIDEKKLKKLSFEFCRSPLGDIIVENNSKDQEAKLLYFENKN